MEQVLIAGAVSVLEAFFVIATLVAYLSVMILIAQWVGRKGHSAAISFLVGLFLSPVLQAIIAVLLSDRRQAA